MTREDLAPRQERSRQTLARLLAAAIEVLDRDGLDGATIPRIAATAGIAPASLYRRFRDKDALFRATFLGALEQSAATFRPLQLRTFKDPSLEGVVSELLWAVIRQYRSHPGLLAALVRFFENDTDVTFKAEAMRYIAGNAIVIVDLLMHFQDRIAHPDPRRALTFALLSVATSIEEITLQKTSLWHTLLPLTDEELHAELTRAFLSYLLTPS